MKLHHIGIATSDIEKAIAHHEMLFHIKPITPIIEDHVQNVSVVLLSNSEINDTPIELIAPLSKVSPVSNFLKKAIHLYHICFEVDNIDSALNEAIKHKSILLSKPAPAELFNNRRVAFVYTSEGYIVEFLEKSRET